MSLFNVALVCSIVLMVVLLALAGGIGVVYFQAAFWLVGYVAYKTM